MSNSLNSIKKRYKGAKVKGIVDGKVVLTKSIDNQTIGKEVHAEFKVPVHSFEEEVGDPKTVGIV